MPKVKKRNYSIYTVEACRLLGLLVRNGRKEKGMSVEELAERAGTSPSFIRRLEQGGLKGEIGIAFEAAFIAGVPLFSPDATSAPTLSSIQSELSRAEKIASLLPKTVHKPKEHVDDDF